MYTQAELQGVAKTLIDISTEQQTAEPIIRSFKKQHSWAQKLLASEEDKEMLQKICNENPKVQTRKEPLPEGEEDLPITKRTKPTWMEISIQGKSGSIVIHCNRTHQSRFMPNSYVIDTAMEKK